MNAISDPPRYRCVAASVEGFIQQVAVSYIRTGHYFYVSGVLAPEAHADAIDAKLILKYGVDVSRWARALRKANGEANLQYIRHDRFFLLMATHGRSLFFELEGEQVCDCRRQPIKYGGYSLSFRGGHSHVRIDLETYLGFKAQMLEESLRRDRDALERLLSIPMFVPYAPVRRQLWNVCREMNRVRSAAGLSLLRTECLNFRRRIVRPFGELGAGVAARKLGDAVDGLQEEMTMRDETSDREEWEKLNGPQAELPRPEAGRVAVPGKINVHAGDVAKVLLGGQEAAPKAVFPTGWDDVREERERAPDAEVPGNLWPDADSTRPEGKGRGREPGR